MTMRLATIATAFVALGVSALAIPPVPRKSPEFVFVEASGKQTLLSTLKGKVVVFALMHTTCPHCQREAVMLTKLQNELGPRGLQVVGTAFNDANPGMVAGIDVFKNPSAEHIEGGIGGLVNIRTRHPLDLKGLTIAGAITGRYNEMVKKVRPEVFGLIADKWNVGDGGEIGILVAADYQTSWNRSDNNPANGGTNFRRRLQQGGVALERHLLQIFQPQQRPLGFCLCYA